MRRHHAVAAVGALLAALAVVVPSGVSAPAKTERGAFANNRVVAEQHRNGVPFTALDVALIVGGGGGLIAAGAGLRRAAVKKA
jgi:hypothetical protein